MNTYQVTTVVNEHGELVIPAPLDKAGAQLRLVIVWEEETPPKRREQLAEQYAELAAMWDDLIDDIADEQWLPVENEALFQFEKALED